jgi:hypothetical protein
LVLRYPLLVGGKQLAVETIELVLHQHFGLVRQVVKPIVLNLSRKFVLELLVFHIQLEILN